MSAGQFQCAGKNSVVSVSRYATSRQRRIFVYLFGINVVISLVCSFVRSFAYSFIWFVPLKSFVRMNIRSHLIDWPFDSQNGCSQNDQFGQATKFKWNFSKNRWHDYTIFLTPASFNAHFEFISSNFCYIRWFVRSFVRSHICKSIKCGMMKNFSIFLCVSSFI